MEEVYPAIKYIFDLGRKEFVDVQTNIRINPNGLRFESGGMRACFQVEEIDEEGCIANMVAKVFKHDIPNIDEIDYFNEAMAQCMCEEFASNFNKKRLPKKISFLACNVVRIYKETIPEYPDPNSLFGFLIPTTKECLFVMEYMMDGEFTKYNNNFGEVYASSNNRNATAIERAKFKECFLTAEAFSHFTLQETRGSMLVCDLQGVNDLFTDPQIHTEDGNGLGMGNMGQEGITKWVLTHRCNEICKRIGLMPLTPNCFDRQPSRYSELIQNMRQSVIMHQHRSDTLERTNPLVRRPGETEDARINRIKNMTEEEQMEAVLEASKLLH